MTDFPITVVIPTHGRAELLGRTLDSLVVCERPANYVSTIVIENGSRGGAEQTTSRFAESLNARYIHLEVGNKSAALNHVLNELRGHFLFLTDDDVRFDPQTLVAYARAAVAGPGTYFGGPTEVDYECRPAEWLIAYLPTSARGFRWTGTSDKVDRSGMMGFNWAAFADDLLRAGGFDINRGPGAASGSTGQEGEMQKRLLQHGVKGQYVPDALVWHYVPAERCDADWLIGRAHRHGVSRGIEMVRNGEVTSVGALYMRRRLKQFARDLRALCTQSERWAFRARFSGSYDGGVEHGIRFELGRRSSLPITR
jgi:glycosyltransferase involved in cell wall biosynthesis